MHDYTQNFIMPLAIAVITSYLTVKLSIRQFCSQKWWEKKSEAYSHIIEQLSRLKYFFREWSGTIEESKKLGLEFQKKLHEEYMEAEKEIIKAAASGSYIISEEGTNALEKLLTELAQKDQLKDVLDNHDSVKNCITEIRKFARKDLKL